MKDYLEFYDEIKNGDMYFNMRMDAIEEVVKFTNTLESKKDIIIDGITQSVNCITITILFEDTYDKTRSNQKQIVFQELKDTHVGVLYRPIDEDIESSLIAVCGKDYLVSPSLIVLVKRWNGFGLYYKKPTKTNRRKFWIEIHNPWFSEQLVVEDGEHGDFNYRRLHEIEEGAFMNDTLIYSNRQSIRENSREVYMFDPTITFLHDDDEVKALYIGNLTDEIINEGPSEWYQGESYTQKDSFLGIRRLESIIQTISRTYLTSGDINIKRNEVKANKLKEQYCDKDDDIFQEQSLDTESFDYILKKIHPKIYGVYNTGSNKIAVVVEEAGIFISIGSSAFDDRNNVLRRDNIIRCIDYTEDVLNEINSIARQRVEV